MTPAEGIAIGKSRSDCAPENIDALVTLIGELDAQKVPGDIVECGSWRCGASIAMAAAAPQRHVLACDLFGGRPYPDRAEFANFADVSFGKISDAVQPFPNLELVRGRHESTLPTLAHRIGPVALVFMDSDFYKSHRACLAALWLKLSPGGIVIFHDWVFPEVQKAIADALAAGEIYGSDRERSGPLTRLNSPNMGMMRKRIG